jgi:hypothetical protein
MFCGPQQIRGCIAYHFTKKILLQHRGRVGLAASIEHTSTSSKGAAWCVCGVHIVLSIGGSGGSLLVQCTEDGNGYTAWVELCVALDIMSVQSGMRS